MPFAMFNGETTISDLVARLFPQPGKGSKAATKQATEGLLQANPHLNDLASVPAGSLIVIPDGLPPVAASEQVAVPHASQGRTVDRARQSMDAVAARLAGIDTLARDAAQALLGLAQSKSVADEQESFSDLTAALPSGTKAAQARVKDLEVSRQAREGVFSSLADQLGSISNA